MSQKHSFIQAPLGKLAPNLGNSPQELLAMSTIAASRIQSLQWSHEQQSVVQA